MLKNGLDVTSIFKSQSTRETTEARLFAGTAPDGAALEEARRMQLRLRHKLQQRQTADFYYLIDVVGTCNLRCPSCPVGNYEVLPPQGLMSIGMYQAILDKISSEHGGERVFIDLYNWGEPSLHKQLGEIVRLTKEHGFGVGISTNLNLFPDMKEVVRASPSYIRVSLSGYFNQTYKLTHKRGDINLVKSNLYLLRNLIDTSGSDTIVQVGFHVYKRNFPTDFQKMLELCQELDFIFAPTLAALMPVEKAIRAVDGKELDREREILDNLVVSMQDRTGLLAVLRAKYPDCQFRQKRTTINFDGSVPLCCATFDDEQIIARNFLEIPREALQTRKYKHGFCAQCQARSLDMVYTNVEPHLVEDFAVSVLGPRYREFLDQWNVGFEAGVEWEGRELPVQEAFDLATSYEAGGDPTTAKRLLAAIVSEFPSHGEAKYRLGLIAEREGDSQTALEFYEAAQSIWPRHPPYVEAASRLKAGGGCLGATRDN